MKILLTGFEKFYGVNLNSTIPVLELIQSKSYSIFKEILKTEYDFAGKRITELLKDIKPDIAISLGMASTSNTIKLERFAVNLKESTAPDNKGIRLKEKKILENKDIAFQVNIPLSPLKNMLINIGIPTSISNTAGTYVCNSTMYNSLHTIKKYSLKTKYLFIHIPSLPLEASQNYNSSMSFSLITKAIKYIMAFAAKDIMNVDFMTYLSEDDYTIRLWQYSDYMYFTNNFDSAKFKTFSEWIEFTEDWKNHISYVICINHSHPIGELCLYQNLDFNIKFINKYFKEKYFEKIKIKMNMFLNKYK